MGIHVTDEQINQWVAEAEAGYDVDELQQRGRGRPGRGAEPSQIVGIRLTASELAAIDNNAAKQGISRAELLRRAVTDHTAA